MNNNPILLGAWLLIAIVLASFDTTVHAQTNAEAFIIAGRSNFQIGRFSMAITNFTKAIGLNTNSLEAYFGRGMAECQITNYRAAVADFDVIIESTNTNYLGWTYNERGRSKSALKDWKGAIADFNKAIELEPKMSETFYNRGLAQTNLKNFTKAITDYTEAIKLHTDRHEEDIYLARGWAEFQIENFSEAISDFTKAIELEPTMAQAYRDRGAANANLKKFPEAIADFNKAIELNPDDHLSRSNLAKIRKELIDSKK